MSDVNNILFLAERVKAACVRERNDSVVGTDSITGMDGLVGNEWLLLIPSDLKGRALFVIGEPTDSPLLATSWFEQIDVWDLTPMRSTSKSGANSACSSSMSISYLQKTDLTRKLRLCRKEYDLVVFYFASDAREGTHVTRMKFVIESAAKILSSRGSCVIVARNALSLNALRERWLSWPFNPRKLEGHSIISTNSLDSLAESSGLPEFDRFFLFPDHPGPTEIGQFGRREYSSRAKYWVGKALRNIGLQYLIHRTIVLCYHRKKRWTLLESFVRSLCSENEEEVIRIDKWVSIRNANTVLGRYWINDEMRYFRIPLSKFAYLRQKRALQLTDQLRAEFPREGSAIPDIVKITEFRGIWGYGEKSIDGYVIKDLIPKKVGHRRVMAGVFHWIACFHQRTQSARIATKVLLQDQIELPCLTLSERPSDIGSTIRQVIRYLRDNLSDYDIPLVWMHGDFNPGNIICNRNFEIRGVLDWDRSQREGLPVVDLIHFLISFRRAEVGIAQGAAILAAASGDLLKSTDLNLIETYCDILGLKSNIFDCWVRIYWLCLLIQHVDAVDGTLSSAALKNVYFPVSTLFGSES